MQNYFEVSAAVNSSSETEGHNSAISKIKFEIIYIYNQSPKRLPMYKYINIKIYLTRDYTAQ